MLNARDQIIFQEFCDKVREPLPDARIFAYGSRARGNHEEDSDFDICVVIDEMTDANERLVSHIAWEVGFEHDLLIQTLVFSSDDFDRGPLSVSPIVRAIKREGLAA